jgi:nuclear pore complex protein Nup133
MGLQGLLQGIALLLLLLFIVLYAQDFPQFLFNWYIQEQKQGKLLEKFRDSQKSREHQQALSQFLLDHPSLSWLQNIFTGDYKQASCILRSLSEEENELLQRKKVVPHVTRSLLISNKNFNYFL